MRLPIHQVPVSDILKDLPPEICFRLNGIFTCRTTGKKYTGAYNIRQTEDGYLLSQADHREPVSLPLTFEPENDTTSDFDLTDVVIGIQFHWERKENQKFKGKLKIIDEQKHLTAINILSLEDYLLSVISSEMRATSSAEFLKAHAVISRSWLLAQINKAKTVRGTYSSYRVDQEEYIRWYDREDHAHFDVCADDHCQRYQGISKAYTPAVREALEATRGEVLTYEGTICDARFSKCCGGATERFDNTWEPVVHPYLDKITDAPEDLETGDLRDEQTARKWILSFPPAFCHTTDRQILSQVLRQLTWILCLLWQLHVMLVWHCLVKTVSRKSISRALRCQLQNTTILLKMSMNLQIQSVLHLRLQNQADLVLSLWISQKT